MSLANAFKNADDDHTQAQRALRYTAVRLLFETWSAQVNDEGSNFEEAGERVLGTSIADYRNEHYEVSSAEIMNILYRLDHDLLLAAARRISKNIH